MKPVKIAAWMLAMTMFLCTNCSVFATGGTFLDVAAGHWAYAAVERAFSDKAVEGSYYNPGTGERRFEPERDVTVAEFVAVLTRSFFPEELKTTQAGLAFPSTPWYDPYIRAGRDAGLFENAEQLADAPDKALIRYDMAVLLGNLFCRFSDTVPSQLDPALDPPKAEEIVADWSVIPEPYRDAVLLTVRSGLLQGVDEKGIFDGESTLTRAQMVTIYCRVADWLHSMGKPEAPTEPVSPDPADPIPVPVPIEPPVVTE
ncbi:MAG: hypothetical protein IJT76_04455 [Clostridia bacterium]|nr:hypothetical protein [Clostridia bacterium]